jgi:heptosyltransferase-1
MYSPENILLIRLKSIGDIVLTLPAVHAVRENFPDAKLHFLVSRELASLVHGFRDIDEIIPLDRSAYRGGNLKRMGMDTWHLLRDLRRKKFSKVIDFQGYGETEMLAWWSSAVERWGSVYNPWRGWMYTQGIPRNAHFQIADWNLHLLRQCGLKIGQRRNEFVLPPEALARAKKFFAANNLDENKPTLYLQPFTSSPQKNWPLKNYMKLAWLWQSRGVQILFGSGISDRESLESAGAAGFPISIGAPLLVSAGIIKLSTLVVGGDTGFLHLATAMQKRVVMLSGSAGQPAHPYQHRDWRIAPTTGNLRTFRLNRSLRHVSAVLRKWASRGPIFKPILRLY